MHGRLLRWAPLFLWAALFLRFGECAGVCQEDDSDWIRGSYSVMLRSFSDRIYGGSDFRREIDHDRWLLYSHLNIQKLGIYQDDDWRVHASGSAWLRQDLAGQPGVSSNRADISYGAIQIDNGRASDGFLKLGRIYNFQGLIHQRFDGGEFYYPINDFLDFDLYGGRRPYEMIEGGDNGALTGGRVGLRFDRRAAIGLSWLLSKTDGQWDDQKIGGDWRFAPNERWELYGSWGYDQLANELYEAEIATRISLTREVDFRVIYEHIIPGLYIPKSSIFSVFSLAEEDSITTQLIYRPNRHWTLMADFMHIDYGNEGGMGGPNNFFTANNALDGGYQWRYGLEATYRHNENDELSIRFEQMLEAEFGYTATDLIRNNFDFRDYDIFNTPASDEGFVFGSLENGFSSIGFHHWHQWTQRFAHAFNFYYNFYDNPLFIHGEGDESFSSNLTLSYKFNRTWDSSIGGRYIGSLADEEESQFFLRVTYHF